MMNIMNKRIVKFELSAIFDDATPVLPVDACDWEFILLHAIAVGNVTRLPWDVAVPFWHLCEVDYDQLCFVPSHLGRQNDSVSG